ncbi:MAG TPA: lantibiotic dehydratase, partial [Pedobacter sp.]
MDQTAMLNAGKTKSALIRVSYHQKAIERNGTLFQIRQMEAELNDILRNVAVANKLNIILQGSVTGPVPGMEYQDHLRDGLAALECLAPTGQQSTMAQFVQDFQQHFEGQTLPLLQALDPEAGIGYQHPEKEKNNPLLETLNIPYKSQILPDGTWTSAHSVLMEAWLKSKEDTPVIRLLENDLHRLKIKEGPQQILGMSVLFRITDNKVFIESAGGINAPALMGRFTVIDEEIQAAAQNMARQLEMQNPDIIFAELLHLADPHTDNVNRRAHIYQYELPVTAASTLPECKQIQLSDLYVKIVNSKVVLFSEKHQKAVIPRLTSAYNHGLNRLPLFRFLADIPYQYGRANLGLELRSLFPNLQFYARVEYKETILSLATWIITDDQLFELQQGEQGQTLTAFSKLSEAIKLPRYFSLAEGDQELVFDSEQTSELLFFLKCIRQKKEAVLKEFLHQPVVKQFNAYLLPREPIVLPAFQPQMVSYKNQRKYMPGSDWLYLKVYAPKIGVNRLLLRLSPLLARRYGKHRIQE